MKITNKKNSDLQIQQFYWPYSFLLQTFTQAYSTHSVFNLCLKYHQLMMGVFIVQVENGEKPFCCKEVPM
jgi:hypothetical protein